jgi:hypothetical protein
LSCDELLRDVLSHPAPLRPWTSSRSWLSQGRRRPAVVIILGSLGCRPWVIEPCSAIALSWWGREGAVTPSRRGCPEGGVIPRSGRRRSWSQLACDGRGAAMGCDGHLCRGHSSGGHLACRVSTQAEWVRARIPPGRRARHRGCHGSSAMHHPPSAIRRPDVVTAVAVRRRAGEARRTVKTAARPPR